MKYRENGLSLIEWAIVMLLFSLVSLTVLHRSDYLLKKLQLEQVARQLRQFILKYQQQALWLNTDYRLLLQEQDSGGNLVIIKSVTGKGDSGNEVVASFFVQDNRIKLSLGSAGLRRDLTLYGKRATSNAGHILISNVTGELKLIISSLGRIRLLDCQGSC